MTYYDQHLHTHFSFDSEETFENYLKKTKNPLVTTEHLDFNNPITNFSHSTPDYDGYAKKIDSLNEEYPQKILKGIEIGYVKNDTQLITDYLSDKLFDVQLLSVHQNGTFDFMEDCVLEMNQAALIEEYYTAMLDAVRTIDSANILTHFDYGVRRINVNLDDFIKVADTYLKEIFTVAIQKDLAFELNAKSFVKFNNRSLYEYAIPLYQSLGGKLFTLGSDAHVAGDYELGFEEMKGLLTKNGVTQLATYQQQKLKLVDM